MDNRIKTIADHYGYEAQSRQCMEECAELIQAINKLWRVENNPDEYSETTCNRRTEDVIKEMADVQIMLWQMQCFLVTNEVKLRELMDVTNSKLERQMQRIKEENA